MIDGLNAKQSEAVEWTQGPVLILAGAGSGKTRVLTYRMAHLIKNLGVKPWEIFAVTFTNKAAGEMKERVSKILGDDAASDMWVATFHSACLRILRTHADAIGFKKDFTIYDDRDQKEAINQCLKELEINPKSFNPKAIAGRINRAKNEAITADKFGEDGLDFFDERVQKVYVQYQEKLKTNHAMDFGDLILNVITLFKKNPEILKKYQNRFRFLHIDEYQDTNKCQYELINLLASVHRNLCVVGDDDQSIYKFRGAEIRNILDFNKDYPDAHVVRLEQNYRSTQYILQAASSVVSHNKGRMGKTIWSANEGGEKITLYQCTDEKEEAKHIASEIKKRSENVRLRDMALFYRTHAQSRALEDEFRKMGIPYAIIGGMKFYDRMEIKDMIAYLKLMVNPDDGMSLKRVINVPLRGIGKTTIEKMELQASQANVSLWGLIQLMAQGEFKGLISSAALSKVLHFSKLIHKLKTDRKNMSLVDFMTHLFSETGYWGMLQSQNSIESEARMENLEEFVSVVADFAQDAPDPSLEAFLDHASLSTDLDNQDNTLDRISMMTFHLAKGLEFKVVYMVGMEEGVFPHSRSLELDEDIEEERRLCYVGMTRAMEKLIISNARTRRLFGTAQFNFPSRFLSEIPNDLLEHAGVVHQERFSKDDFSDSSSYSFDQSTVDDLPVFQTQATNPYQRGRKVKHPVFGVGVIKACEGAVDSQKLTIAFQNGEIKKILTKYARLEMM